MTEDEKTAEAKIKADAAEAKKVADAQKKIDDAAEAKKLKASKQPTEDEIKAAKKAARLKAEGFHNCTKLKLDVNGNGQIIGIAKKGQKIKAMHESNIDVFNSQQVNSHLFIKKDGVGIELTEVKIKGRKHSLKMYMDKK